jgi:hypothetical protein
MPLSAIVNTNFVNKLLPTEATSLDLKTPFSLNHSFSPADGRWQMGCWFWMKCSQKKVFSCIHN